MSIKLVQPLEKAIDVNLCGGKAAALGELIRAGFETVGGFVVTTAAFGKMDNDLKAEILRNYDYLRSKYVAVRSSAVAEDSKEAAWAGQLDTFLNVSRDELIDSIKKCWDSIGSDRASSYAKQHKIKSGKVAVIVQPMIQFYGGGVAFSIHPVTKEADKIVIEMALGLETVVSGETTPDTYVVNKSSQEILEKHVAAQTRKMTQGKDGKTQWEKIGSEGAKQKLSDKKIKELSKQIVKLEKHFSFPVDVEWGLIDNKIFIMQCRPITALQKSVSKQPSPKLDKKDNYLFEFEAEGLGLLFSDMLMQTYGPGGVIEIYSQGTIREYVHKPALLKNYTESIKIYGSKLTLKTYLQDLDKLFQNSEQKFKTVLNNPPTKDMVEDFFATAKEILDVYSKLDPLYTDKVFNQSLKDQKLAQNIKKIEKPKEKYRTDINKLLLEKNNYFEQLVAKLAKHFKLTTNKLEWLTIKELKQVFNAQEPGKKILEERREAFIQIWDAGRIWTYSGAVAVRDIKKFDEIVDGRDLIIGSVANSSSNPVIRGQVRVINTDYSNPRGLQNKIRQMKKGEILVAPTTAPELMLACRKAAAIVTDTGGLLSHAAIVSRELNILCIVGTERASKVLNDGDEVEVDADQGIVRVLRRKNV